MINAILGTKLGNSQTFVEGFRIPVTKVAVSPSIITQIKKMDGDGYWAVQLGFGNRKVKNLTKPLQNHFKKSNSTPRFIREIRLKEEPTVKVGDKIQASDFFKAGDVVAVTGVSKGKGFASGIKLHHFRGGPRTHGQSDRERAPGSIGQTTTPGRVYRGKRMAARMGTNTVTVANLHVISVDSEKFEMVISGQIPGPIGNLVTIKKIKEGSLKELEHEVVAQVVEGEGEAEAATGTPAASVPAPEGGQTNES